VHSYYVYILSNRSRTLYTGVTNDLARRMYEHKRGLVPGFTRQYHVHQLVYFEETNDVNEAIVRERQIKGWTRARKIALIKTMNPFWNDLARELVEVSS
jgi:putative endonuclease